MVLITHLPIRWITGFWITAVSWTHWGLCHTSSFSSALFPSSSSVSGFILRKDRSLSLDEMDEIELCIDLIWRLGGVVALLVVSLPHSVHYSELWVLWFPPVSQKPARRWTGYWKIAPRCDYTCTVYSHLTASVPGIGSWSTTALTKIKHLEMNEWMNE